MSAVRCVCDLLGEANWARLGDNERLAQLLRDMCEKLFADYEAFQAEHMRLEASLATSVASGAAATGLAVQLKCVTNLKRQLAANILNVCRAYTASMPGEVCAAVCARSLAVVRADAGVHATQIERVIFMQSTIHCAFERLDTYDAQAAFVDQFLEVNLYFIQFSLLFSFKM